MRARSIALSSADIGPDEHRLVGEVLRTGQLANGPMLRAFEREFAARFGARHAIATSSGTAALHIAMIAAGVRDGDIVITTPFSFVASANAVLFERGVPHFVDIDPHTLNMDPAATVKAIDRLAPTGRLRAVLPVHVFGRPVDMEEILIAARRHNIPVIEDACEAIGASAHGVFAGRFGDAAAFGFYPNKQMTTGEGGIFLTDREDWAQLARSLRNQGRSTDSKWLQHDILGFNYRLDDLSAAIGLAQIRRFDELLAKRQAVADRYHQLLSTVDDVTPLEAVPAGIRRSWFVYVVRVAPEIGRDRLMQALAARGIDSRAYFPPIHLQPLYRTRFGFVEGMFPNAETAGATMLALPFHANLSASDAEYVVHCIAEEVAAMRVSR